MPQPPRNDGWKHKGATPANKPAAQHTPNTSRKQWQPGAPKPKTTGRKTSRVARFVLAGVVVGLLSAVVITLILFLWPSDYPNFVVVAPDEADWLALPENQAGVASAQGVEEWATGKKELRGEVSAGRDVTAARDDADPREAWAKNLTAKNNSTVVYFATHVGVDATGPYLWLPRAKGGPPEKLYVEKVVQKLGDLKRPTLLVVDIAQTPANWAFGGAYCDFPQAVKGLDDKIEAAGQVAVLLSADAGQTSWAAEERRKTAFGFHFLEGLRGAAGPPHKTLHAADLAKYLRTEVQKWAVANREANQEPLLLPRGSGEARAAKVTLTTLPPAPYAPPGPPAAAPATPPELAAEWARVARLTDPKRGTPPDTADPLTWREYLEWLLRWERLVRLEAVPPGLPGKVRALGARLADPTAAAVACEGVALPAGPALSGVAAEAKDLPLGRLWAPRTDQGFDLGKEWVKLKAESQVSTPALQVAAARSVVERVLAEGVTRTSLDTAELVLAEVGGVQPVEAHYLRMLQRHLPADTSAWPNADLLKRAVSLRRTAEETAWAAGQPYPEQAFRWTHKQIAAADRERQLGEDLLFDVKPESHAQAAGHFQTAEDGYAAARKRAGVVSAALSARDRVFARLPYYARWVAATRGGPVLPDDLVPKLEQAARAAHEIDRLMRAEGAGDDAALAAQTTQAEAFDFVVQKFDDATALLTEQKQGSNLHHLDAALGVPFRKHAAGVDWSKFARDAAAELASRPPKSSVERVSEADPLPAAAERHLRAAAAYLEVPNLARGTVLPSRSDALVTALRGLPGETAKAREEADARAKLTDAGGDYAAANRLARLCDPAFPAGGAPAPPAADRHFRRHYFLLAQAGRITLDGWCGTKSDEQAVENWYCSAAAAKVLDDADAELGALVPGRADLPPVRQGRLTADLKDARGRKPTTLNERKEKRVVVPDEFRLRHSLQLAAAGGPVGYPVCEYTLPAGLAAVKANADLARRQVERGLKDQSGGAVVREKTFDRGGGAIEAGSDLAAVVRYRGRVYTHAVTLDSATDYTLRVVNVPPTGKGAIAVQAAPKAITGAVTILIDRSGSMAEKVAGGTDRRILQAREGIRQLVAGMPAGTQLTVAGFHGKGNVLECKPLVERFVVREPKADADKLFDDLDSLAEPVAGAATPLAGAMRTILHPRTGEKFWPDKYTGRRTLVVISDGKDTWYDDDGKRNPGYTLDDDTPLKARDLWQVVEAGLKASLKATTDNKARFFGVDVRLVLFGIDGEDEKEVERQFDPLTKVIESDPALADSKFRIHKGVKSGQAFADLLRQAVMPRVWYSSDKNPPGVLESTRDSDLAYNSSAELVPGTFDLTDGTKMFPRVQVGEGERKLLLVEPDGRDKVRITVPPFALRLAEGQRLPHKLSSPTGPGVALSLAQLRYTPRDKASTLDAVVTFEKVDPNANDNPLRSASRDYAWFDLALPDGTRFDRANPPKVTIRNHLERSESGDWYELLAPAWDVSVEKWDKSDGRKFRRPQVTGYWVNGLPPSPRHQVVTPAPPTGGTPGSLPLKAFESGGDRVPVLDAVVREDGGKLFATVWMDYQTPGELVLLRAVEWQNGRVPETHTYYDPHGRYTATFGPLLPSQLGQPVKFELYTVKDLRDKATADKLTVKLDGKENCDDADQYRELPDRLKMVGKPVK